MVQHYNNIFSVVIVAYQGATGRVDRKAGLNARGHERWSVLRESMLVVAGVQGNNVPLLTIRAEWRNVKIAG